MGWWGKHARFLLVALLVALSVASLPHIAWTANPEQQPSAISAATIPNDRLGINQISTADIVKTQAANLPTRYQKATDAGARWNRWPMYWPEVESSSGSFNYSVYDNVANWDRNKGFQANVVLMNTPGWATTAAAAPMEAPASRVGEGPHLIGPVSPPVGPTAISPATAPLKNLDAPVFVDVGGAGSDVPGPGKTINPNNSWARFVYNTVYHYTRRYPGVVKAWEMWNEPDLGTFWSGSASSYYRLLKVGYLAAKFADPNATVLMGGMAYWSNPSFFSQVLGLIKADPSAAANGYYFDATAWHWYSRSSQMYDMVNTTRSTLQSYGLGSKPIWVNETGVPIWDDPAKKPFGGSNTPYFASATQDEAASYVIQAIAYGLAAGVQRIIYFQEYDDGNNEAFGLLRNDDSQRPSYAAHQVASQYLLNYTAVQKITDEKVEKIVFLFSEPPSRKVTVLWNKSPVDLTYSLLAAPGATQPYRVDKAGNVTPLTKGSTYSMLLPRATDNNCNPNPPQGYPSNYQCTSIDDYIIGGSPYLIVEQIPSDTTPPTSAVLPLIPKLPTQFGIKWSGTDSGWGVASFDIQYRDGSGPWTDWINGTTATSAWFTGTEGHTYYFRSRARDLAGNVELWPAGDAADASTTVAPFPYKAILPSVFNGGRP